MKPPLAFQAYTGHESLFLEKTPLAKSLTGGSSPSKYLIHVENASTAHGVNSVSSIQDNVIVEDGLMMEILKKIKWIMLSQRVILGVAQNSFIPLLITLLKEWKM